ncbi:MAG: CBS domain-containing protein [Opitutales bacterium]|nr:CBS domain-containing protein [Opitutales bacterium]
MTNRFLRISTAHTLREAMGLILYGEEREMDTGAIVVIDQEGNYAGILTPRYVIRGLSKSAAEEQNLHAEGFVESVEQHLSDKIDTVMDRELPKLNKDSSFATIVRLITSQKYECLPVLDENRVVGLVYASDVFKTAANLALTPGQKGISLDR